MILFAFAGYMDFTEFSKLIPSAKKIGVAKLPGYTIAFNKTADDLSSKANIAVSFDPNDVVWGILIQLDDNEKANLYKDESWNIDFKLETVSCMGIDGEIYHACAFVAQPHAINFHLLPYDWYHQRIITLAKNAGLPAEYIKKIAAMGFKTDPDNARRLSKLKRLKSKQ
jgi:hypothetical protein